MLQSEPRSGEGAATGYTEKNVISSFYSVCRNVQAYNETTPDRRQSKASILSTNVDKKVRNKVFDIH